MSDTTPEPDEYPLVKAYILYDVGGIDRSVPHHNVLCMAEKRHDDPDHEGETIWASEDPDFLAGLWEWHYATT